MSLASSVFRTFRSRSRLVDKRVQNRGTKICRRNDPEDELEIWEAGRCTSAAPAYFAAYATSRGTFQDGGLKHNCLIEVAIEESKLLWEQDYHLDVAVSIGTGRSKGNDLQSNPTKQQKQPPVSFFALRIWKSFMESIDTEPIWKAFAAKTPATELKKIHRLNATLKDLPSLDDTSKIDSMRKQTIDQFSGATEERQHLRTTARALTAALFYVEILEMNQLSPMSRRVKGQILCRLEPKYQVNLFEVFLLKTYSFTINEVEHRAPPDVVNTIRGGELFRMEFEVIVSKSKELSIGLQIPSSTDGVMDLAGYTHHISGCPMPYDGLRHNEVGVWSLDGV